MRPSSRRRCAVLLPVVLAIGAGCARKASEEPPAPAAAPAQVESLAAERMIVRTADIIVRCERPEVEADRLTKLVGSEGGFVASRRAERLSDEVHRVEVTLRVPVARFEATLSALRATGTVLEESVHGEDVTRQFSHTQATLHAKQGLETRLLAVLQAANTVKDMLEVERELARVRGEIETLEGQSRGLSQDAALSAIRLSLVSPVIPVAASEESVSSRITNAAARGAKLSVSVAAALVEVSAAASPVALPVVGFVLFRRRSTAARAQANLRPA